LNTVQGKQGGVYFQGDASRTSVWDILLATGFSVSLNECLGETGNCPLTGDCKIHIFFQKLERELFNGFKTKMLSKLLFDFESK